MTLVLKPLTFTGTGVQQSSLDAITAVSGATAGHVLTKVGSSAAWAAGGGSPLPGINGGRLTLSSGNGVYNPYPRTPSSTNTTTEIITFASAHGWSTGTMLTPFVTAGGLTLGNVYYVNAASSTTISLHTTLANAIAGTSKVDLTASITNVLLPWGMQGTTIYFTPYCGNTIALYTGTGSVWEYLTFSEISLALGSVTADLPYDIFAYNSGGTLTLEKVAWTNTTTRATTIAQQDGVWCKSGTLTKRYVGTVHTVSTAAVEDSVGGIATNANGKRFVWNVDNQVIQGVRSWDDALHTYNGAEREWGGGTGTRMYFISGLDNTPVHYIPSGHCNKSGNGFPYMYGMLDNTFSSGNQATRYGTSVFSGGNVGGGGYYSGANGSAFYGVTAGLHFFALWEFDNAGSSFYGGTQTAILMG